MKNALLCCFAGFAVLTAHAQLISDDFESVASLGDYSFVDDGTLDGSVLRFDYLAAGIPLAPRSTIGDAYGMRMTANDTLGDPYPITAFHNTAVPYASYYMLVDIWMGVTPGATGTTEHAHIGVGGDGFTYNQIFSPTSGSGAFLAITGEGGSSSDYRWYHDGVAIPSGDASYLSDTQTTNASDPLYQSIFPNGDFPGSPGNQWATLRIDVDGSDIAFSLNGTKIIDGTATLAGDFVSLGYVDAFSSVASPFQAQFVIYDNLEVGQRQTDPSVPEPAAAFSPFVLLGTFGLLRALRRRRR